jgi:hypothetical protein
MEFSGVTADAKDLENKIISDLEKCSQRMRKVRQSTMLLKANIASNAQ